MILLTWNCAPVVKVHAESPSIRSTFIMEEGTDVSGDAAFDLYLWPVGAGPSAAVRLTADETFDGWPDVFVPRPTEPSAPDGGVATANANE